MANLDRLRRRLPLIVFLLLAIVVVMLLGFACACLTEDPMQALERLLYAPAAPEAMAAWVALLAALATWPLVTRVHRRAADRASPALLQRFRF